MAKKAKRSEDVIGSRTAEVLVINEEFRLVRDENATGLGEETRSELIMKIAEMTNMDDAKRLIAEAC